MVNERRPEKKRIHWNHVYLNGFVIMVLFQFITCAPMMSCADPTDTEANNTITINCSGLKTCKKCAENPSCLWSLERQACFADYGTLLSLTVRAETDCPSVSVVSNVTYVPRLPYVYMLKVENDVTGFLEFLEQTRMWCVMLDVTRPAGVYGDTIHCSPVNQTDLGFDHLQTFMTYHCYVMFGDGDTILRLDDGADSYFTVYDEYHEGYRPDESCVTCLWDVGQFTYYYKWCPSRNLATGRYRFYVGYSDTDHTAVMPAEDRLSATVPSSSGCKDVRIQSVEPLFGLWTGGQQVTVKVNNYVTLADGKGEVKVTVAGRDCVRLTMVDRRKGMITCLLASHDDMGPRADEQGPVVIAYKASSLTVVSTQSFRFVYPKITDLSPLCGPLTGGTLLTIRGRHLDVGSLVTIAVAVGDDAIPSLVPCETVARHSDRILCLTGPSSRPAAGTVSVVFDKTLRLQNGTAGGPLVFTYAAEPVLAAGQQFGGIASGGTAMPVRGTGFVCVSDATMYVDRGGVRRVAAGHCHPVNDTYMVCGTPKLDGPRVGALPERLRFGFRVRYAYGHISDIPPPPDTDGYVAHADPVLEDFVVLPNGRSMLINGPDLGHGYRAAEVVVVRFSKNLTVAACNVTAVNPRHIVCESNSPDGVNSVSVIVVTIGDQFAYTVYRRMNFDQPKSFKRLAIISILMSAFALVFSYYKLKFMIIAHLANTI